MFNRVFVPVASALLICLHTVACQPFASVVSQGDKLSSITAEPASVVADGNARATLSVAIRHADGTSVAGLNVVLAASGGNVVLVQPPPTDATGQTVGYISSTSIGPQIITAAVADGNKITLLEAAATVNFTDPAAALTSMILTLTPSAVSSTADGQQSISYTLLVTDATGIARIDEPVTITSTGANNTLSPDHGATDNMGAFMFAQTSTSAEIKTLVATAGQSQTRLQVTFLPGPLSSTGSTLTILPSSLMGDGASQATVYAVAADAFGNGIANAAVTIRDSDAADTVSANAATSDATGTVFATITSTVLGQKSVSAVFADFTLVQPLEVIALSPSSLSSSLSIGPGSVVADGASTATVTVTAKTPAGVIIPNQRVSLSVTGSTNALSPTQGFTDNHGVFTASLTSTKAESKSITATLGQTSISASATFVSGAPSHNTTTILVTPNQVVADGNTKALFTVSARDVSGNLSPGETVSFMASGTDNTLSILGGKTNAQGQLSASLSSTHAEIKTITAILRSASVNAQVNFTANAASFNGSSLSANPNVVVADGNSTTTLSVRLVDAQLNAVAAQAVSLSASGSGNFFGANQGVTDSSGVYTTTLASNVAELKQVTAQLGSLRVSLPVSFVPGVANASQSTLTASPNAVAADGNSVSTLTVVARDATGNLIANQAVQLSVSGGNSTLSSAQGSTNSAGVFVAQLRATTSEARTVIAQLGSAYLVQQVTFFPTSASIATSSFVASPSPVTADGAAHTIVTLVAHDVLDNPLANANVTFSATGLANSFAQATGKTDASGSYTTTLSSTHAEVKHLTASIGAVSLNTNTTFVAGPPNGAHSSLIASPASIVADNAHVAALQLTVRDAFDNPIAGQTASITASGTNNIVTQSVSQTDANGVLNATVASSVAESKIATGLFSGNTASATLNFVAGPAASTTSLWTASPNSVVADGTTKSTLNLTLLDAYGNAVPSTSVAFGASGSGNVWGQSTAVTDVAGHAQTTLASTHAEVKNVTASVGAVHLTIPVAFVAGAAVSSQTTLGISPNQLVADGVAQTTLSLVVRDAQNNPVANQAVSLTVSGTNNTASTPPSATDANGLLTMTLKSTVAEVKTVSANFNGTGVAQTVTFIAGPPAAASSSITASPNHVVADGSTQTTLSVTVQDAFYNLVGNQNVSLAISGSSNTSPAAAGRTNAAGVWSSTLASTVAQTKTVTATLGAGGAPQVQTVVVFIPGAVSSTKSSIVVNPNSIIANGNSLVTFVARDGQNNLVPNQMTTLSSTQAQDNFDVPAQLTDAAGQAVSRVSATLAASRTLSAAAGGASVSAGWSVTAASPNSTNTTLVSNANVVTADGASAAGLTLVVRDAFGNAVGNQAVSFSISGAHNSLTGASATTSPAGMITASLRSTTAETKTITATAGSASANVLVTFVAGSANAAASALTISPNTVVANNSNTTTLALQARDAQGNPQPFITVNLSASSSNNTFAQSSGSADANGLYVTTLMSSRAELKTVTASFGGTSVQSPVVFVAGPPSSANSQVSVNPNTQVADNASSTTLTVLVADAFGNPVGNLATSLSSTGAANTFATNPITTDTTGAATTTWRSSVAQSKTLTATLGNTGAPTVSTTMLFVPGALSFSNSSFTVNPNSVVADGAAAMTLAVVAKDAQSNVVANQNVVFSTNGTLNNFGALSGQTDTSGQFSTTLRSTRAQLETLQAQVGALNYSQSASFYAGPASQANFVLAASPTTVLADGNATTTLTLTVQDAFGNPVAGQPVSLSATGTANAFAQASANTNAAGQFVTTLRSTRAETKTITATSGALVSQVAVTFVPGNANQTMSSFVIDPNTAIADGAASVGLLVMVRDSTGNAVGGQSVSLSSSGTSNTFAQVSGTTDPNGQFATTLSSTKAQSKTLTASFAAATLSASATFIAGSPSSTTTVLSASPNVITADATSTTTLTVVVRDAYNNRVANQAVSFSASGTANVFAPLSTATTDSTGSVSVSLASSMAEAKTVTVAAAAATASVGVVFVPGAPSQIAWAASPNVVVANNSNTALLTFGVADAAGNPIANANVVFAATGANNTLSTTSGATDAAGHVSLTLASAVAESKDVTATLVSNGAQYTLSVLFVPGPLDPTRSTWTASPNTVTADGNSSATLSFVAADANGNLINAQAVSITSTGTNNVLGAITGNTGSDGHFTTTFKSTLAQTKTVTLQSGGLSFALSINFIPGSISSSTSTLVASPNQLVADGVATSNVTFILRDAQNNVVANQTTSLSATGSANTLSPTSASTDASGQVLATLKSTRAETKLLTVSSGAVSLQTNIVFVPGPPASAQSSITASPSTQIADGASSSTVSVLVADAYANPISNLVVALSSSNNTDVFGASSVSTNASGAASTSLRATLAQTKTLTATLGLPGAPTITTSVTFVAGEISAGQSSFVVNPNSVVADGATSMGLLVTAKDAQNNPVANQNVTFSATGANNSFGALFGQTDPNGRFVTTLASTRAQNETLTAQLGAVNLPQPAAFYAGPATQANFVLSANANSVLADGNNTTTLSVSVQDAFGNPISGQAVSLSSTGSNNQFTVASGLTNAAGIYTATLSSTMAQTKLITASSGALSATVTVNFVAGVANQASSSLVVNPNSQVADGAATIACLVTVRDATGNPVQNQNVTLSSSGTSNTFAQPTGITDSAGQFTTTLRSTKAQAKSITANLGSTSLSAAAVFYAGSPNATTSTLYASPTTATADGNSTIVFSGTIRDAYGNLVAGQSVSFSSTGTDNTFSPVTSTTDASGNVSTSLTSIQAQSKTVTMSAGVANVSTSVTFIAGAANNVSWVASPNNLVANGTALTTLKLTLKDNNNNPLVGAAASWTVSGLGNNPTNASGTTDSTGSITWTLSSTVAEQKNLTVTLAADGSQYTTPVTFVAGPVDAVRSTLSANPNQVTADGSSTTTITFVAQDANGNDVPGAAVAVSASGAGTYLSAPTGVSAIDGSYTTTLSATVAEVKTVSVFAGGLTFTTSVTFVAGSANQSQSSFIASPNSVVADGAALSTLVLTVRDAQNNVAPNVALTLSSSGTANVLSSTTGSTDPNGKFTATLRSTKAESKTVTASFAGTTLQLTVNFVAGSPNSTYTSLLVNPNSQIADGTSSTSLSATIADAFGNLVQGQNVVFTASGTNNVFGQTTVASNASGLAATTLTSTKAQSELLSISAAGASANANMLFVPGGVSIANSSFTLSPNQAVANGAAVMTLFVTAKDAQANLIANQNVSISADGSSNTFGAIFGRTDSSGTFSTTLSSTLAQSETLTAQLGIASYTQSASFIAGPASQANFLLVASQSTVVADNTATTTLTLTAKDAFGNPVANQNITLSATGTSNVFSPSFGQTNAAGQFVATLASAHAEAKTVTATSGALSAQTIVTFIPGAVSQSASSFVVNPNQVVADGQATTLCTVTVRDASNNPILNQNVTLSSSGTNNVFVVASGQTNASGVYTATLASTYAQAKSLGADLGTTSLSAAANFVAGSPNATMTTLVASPTTATADGNSTITLTGVVRDAFGNRVTNQSVSLSSSGGNNTFSSTALTTDATGTISATLSSTLAEPKTITLVAATATVTTPVSFVAGAPSHVSFVASPNTLIANASATSALTLKVADSTFNPIAGANVSFVVSGAGNNLSPMAATTNAAGVINLTLSSSVAETKTVTATLASNNAQYTVQVIFVPGPIDAFVSTLTASPNSLTADGIATSQLTFVAQDANANVVPGAAVSISASGTANTLAQTSGTTNSAGVFQTTLASTVAETKTVSVMAGGKTFTVSVVFVAGGAQANKCSLVASPNQLVANNSATAALTLIVRDAQNNVIKNTPVVFSVSGTANTLVAAGSNTDTTGQQTATLSSTMAESKTVTASFGGTSVQTVVVFVAGPPNNVYSSLVASPNTQVADGATTSALVVTIEDAFANPINAQAVTLAASGSSNIFGATTLSTNALGVAQTTLASSLAQVETLVANAGPANANAVISFVAGAASSPNMTLSASPNSLVADGTAQSTLTLTVRDAHNNPLANQSVTLASTGAGNTLSPTSGTTNASGVFVATLKSTVAQTKTLTATAGAASTSTTVTFVAGPPASAQSSLVASPNSVTADGSSKANLTVVVRDAQNNPIANQSVSLSSTGSANAFVAATGNTDSTGTYTATLASTVAESKTVTASFGAAQASTTVVFVPGGPSASTSTFVASPNNVVADNTATSTLSVTLRDAQNNLISGQAVSFTSTGSNNTLSATTATTDATGAASVTLKSSTAEIKNLTATANGTPLSTTTTFVAGAPYAAYSSVSASPNQLTANGISTSALTLVLQDAFHNLVGNQNVTFTSTGAPTTVTPGSAVTDASGGASATLSSTLAGTKTVTVSFTGGSVTTTVVFAPGAGVAANSSIVASPNSVVADGTTSIPLTVTVRDAQNNAVANQNVTLSASGSNNTFTLSGATNSSGVMTATLVSTLAQTETVTANIGGPTVSCGVLFFAGPAVVATSSLTTSLGTVVADGNTSTTLTLTLKDAQGNLVSPQNAVFTSTGSGNSFTPANGNTTSGVLTTTLSSTVAESKTITATFAGKTLTVVVNFVPGAVNLAQSSFSASPNALIANGIGWTNLTTTLKDAQGNLIANQNVTYSSSGSANTFSQAAGQTNASGVYTATLSSTKAETKTLTSAFAATSLTTTVSFVPGAPYLATSSLVASPNQVTTDGSSTSSLVATIRDAQNNPISSQSVALSTTGTSNIFSPVSGATTNGLFNATVSSTVAQSEVVTATAGAIAPNANVIFLTGAPSSSLSTFTASPNSLVANGSAQSSLTLIVRDSQNNVISNQPVTYSVTGGGTTLSSTTATTNASGVASITLSATVSGSKTVTANFGAASASVTVTFVPGPPSAANSSLTASPNTLTADGTTTSLITLIARDANNNLISSLPVSYVASGGNNTIFTSTGTTNASGQSTTTLASSLVQTENVTANFGGATLAVAVSFVPGAPASANSSIVATPNSLVADGTTASSLLVTVRDAQNNLVPNSAVALSATGTLTTFANPNGTTNASGQYTTTVVSTKAQTETLRATLGSSGTPPNVTTSITFVPGPPAAITSSFVINPNSVTADGNSTMALSVTVADANANLITGATVYLAGSGSNNTFGSVSGPTNSSGLFTTTLASNLAQVETIIASLGSVGGGAPQLTQTATFTAGAASAITSYVAASPNVVTADGTSIATLTASIYDATNNPVMGQNVAFTVSGSNNTITPGTASTNSLGKAQVNLTSTRAESKTITATFNGSSVTNTVLFRAGAPTTANSSIVINPNTGIVADGATTTSIAVTVRDAYNNLVLSYPVALTSTGTVNTFNAANGNTNAVTGVYTATLASTVAQTKTVTATAGAASVTATAMFVAGAPSTGNSSFTASPTTNVLANGVATTSLSATIKDAQGNLVPSYPVTFSATGSGTLYGARTTLTNSAGVAKTTASSTTAVQKTLTMRANAVALNQNVIFIRQTAACTGTLLLPTVPEPAGTGSQPNSIVIADFNGDTYMDFAVGNSNDSTVSVYLGLGNGLMAAPVLYAAGSKPTAIDISDFNADGNLDLLVTNNTANTVTVLFGTSSGTFSTNATLAAGTSPRSAIAVDLNNDGRQDIVVANSASATLSILLGKGDGTFAALTTVAAGTNPTYLNAADVNGDGFADVVVSNTSAASLSVLLGTGLATFTSAPSVASSGGVFQTALVDLNADGILDLVTSSPTQSAIRISYGAGNGNFVYQTYINASSPVYGLTTGDINQDGYADIVAGLVTTSDVAYINFATYFGGAGNTFAGNTGVPAGQRPSGFALGDINRDGYLDIVTTNTLVNTLSAFLGQASKSLSGPTVSNYSSGTTLSTVKQTVLADLDLNGFPDLIGTTGTNSIFAALLPGSGSIGTASLFSTTTGSTVNALAIGDLNLDGQPDVVTANGATNDVSVLLGASGLNFSTAVPYTMDSNTLAVGAIDFNNDGRVDVVTANNTAATVAIRLGNGDGTLGAVTTTAAPTGARLLAIGDLNGDGNQDVVVAGTTPAGPVVALMGGGNGAFTSQNAWTPASTVSSMVLGDFDGDGRVDLAAANVAAGTVVVALGSGSGTFTTGSTLNIAAPNTVVVADINKDGRQDLIVTSSINNTVSIAIGAGDGTFGGFASYHAMQGAYSVVVNDFNNDGMMDILSSGTGYSALTQMLGNGCLSTTPGAKGPYTIALSASPTSTVANGTSTTTLTATLRDPNGNANPNQIVTILVTGSNNTVSKVIGTTNGSGVFTTTMTSTKAEAKTARALSSVADNPQGAAALSFVAGPVAATYTSIVANPNSNVVANNLATTTLTVTAEDANGNPIAGQSVSLSSSASATTTFGASSGVTNSAGVFSTTVVSKTSGPQTLSATMN